MNSRALDQEHARASGRALTTGLFRAARMVLGLVAGAVLALAIGRAALHRGETPLPELGAVPDFKLVEASGRPISRADLAGKVWVADFVFTSCAASCPKMTAEMGRLAEGTHDVTDLKLVSFSVDPETDTPEVLRTYAARHHADPARWWFVTGDDASLRKLAIDGFHIPVEAGDPAEGDAAIIHSEKFALVDRQARIRGYYDATDPESLARLGADLRRLDREPS